MTGNRDKSVRIDGPVVDPNTMAAWSTHLGREIRDPVALRSTLAEGTLSGVFAGTARRRADELALQIGDSAMTHGELDAAASYAAGALQRLGIDSGQPLMLIADTTMPHVVAYLGALKMGAPVVLAHTSLTANELAYMAADSQAVLLIASDKALRTAARADLPGVKDLIGLEEDDRGTTGLLLHDVDSNGYEPAAVDPESPAIMAFTSGTTGRPKCAPLSHRNLLSSIRGAMWAWQWSERDRLVHALPISHQHGLGGLHATLIAGSSATLLRRFDAGRLLDTVADTRATAMFAVPAMYQRLATQTRDRLGALRPLRLIISGSARLPESLALRLEAAVGQVPVERYGTTESGLDVSNPYTGDRRPGTVGLPLPGVEVAIVDQCGEPVEAGTQGEILIRGPQVFSGYIHRDSADGDTFLLDWFRTGDIGLIDEEKRNLRLVDRIKEVIVTGGMNVYPREVEEAISSIPSVTDVAVIGVPSRAWGEEVTAFVCSSESLSKDLADRVLSDLASYKRPKRIYTVAQIPRSETGKVSRDKLLELALAARNDQSPSSL